MRIIKSILLPVILAASLCFGACSNNSSVASYTLNNKLVNITGKEPDEVAEDFKSSLNGNITDASANDDGTVTIKLTDKQRKYVVSFMEERVNDMQDEIKKQDERYKIEVNDDYSELDFYYDQNLDIKMVTALVFGTETYSAYHQIFSDREDWFTTINIYNCDTGKLVATGDTNNDINYDNSDWEASK